MMIRSLIRIFYSYGVPSIAGAWCIAPSHPRESMMVFCWTAGWFCHAHLCCTLLHQPLLCFCFRNCNSIRCLLASTASVPYQPYPLSCCCRIAIACCCWMVSEPSIVSPSLLAVLSPLLTCFRTVPLLYVPQRYGIHVVRDIDTVLAGAGTATTIPRQWPR